MDTKKLAKKLASISAKPAEFKSAYEAGFDAAVNKPNTTNCNFRWFSSRQLSDEWSRGNAAGLSQKK